MGRRFPRKPIKQTWRQLAQHIALQYGLTIDDDHADFALWEQTAFPVCSREHTVRQLHEFFAKATRRPQRVVRS